MATRLFAVPPAAPVAERPLSARERIVSTASALFYGLGIRAVGIDRIIAEAGVAKATFYHHFPTKDALVCAYLAEQHELQVRGFAAPSVPAVSPAEMVLRVFDVLGEVSCGARFRGCPFNNAAVEYPDPESPVRKLIAEHRAWFSGLLRQLLTEAGHPRPDAATSMLVTYRDGVATAGQMGEGEQMRATLRQAVGALLQG